MLRFILALLLAGAPMLAHAQTYPSPTFSTVKIGGANGQTITGVGTAAGTVAAGNDSRIVGAVQSTRQITAGAGLTGGGDLSADRSIALPTTGVSAGSYISSNITVDAYGRVTAAANGSSAAPASFPVRQTVAAGPASGGLPSFLPATSGSLSITATGVSSTVPLIATAAQGFGSSGPVNLTWTYTSNPTWTGLTSSATNFLYVNASTGAAGFSTLAPIYQAGGTPSTANGQFTFDTVAMVGYMGNGSTASATPLVFVGEVVTSASGVTSSAAYAYNGYYDSGYTNTLTAAASRAHNIGATPDTTKYILKNLTSEANYSPGQVIANGIGTASGNFAPIPVYSDRKSMGIPSVVNWQFVNFTTGAVGNMTPANWAYRFVAQRGW